MKIVSIILTTLLLGFAAMYFSAYHMWGDADGKKLNHEVLSSFKTRMLEVTVIILIFFIVSLFLTIKGFYKSNFVLFGCFVLAFLISSILINT